MSYDALKALVSNFDVDAYFKSMGLPVGHDVYVVDDGNVRERNAMLGEVAAGRHQGLAAVGTAARREAVPHPGIHRTVHGIQPGDVRNIDTPKREEVVAASVKQRLGHRSVACTSRSTYAEEQGRRRGTDREIRASSARACRTAHGCLHRRAPMRSRSSTRSTSRWGTDRWIDYSGVDIRRDDYFGNMLRLNEFDTRRNLAKFGKPIAEDGFADPRATLPTVVNAA